MENTNISTIIKKMSPEQYKLTIGEKSAVPLQKAFPRKRVIHPGAMGKMIPPKSYQAIWHDLLAQNNLTARQRTAYIHIPFCSQQCLYCGFFQNHCDNDRETLYIDHLIRQLKAAKEYSYLQASPLEAVYLGGGTPSALSDSNISRLLIAVQNLLPLTNDCEITLEARVNDLVDKKISSWLVNGVNRISIGVQSFDTEIRRRLGRKDSREIIFENICRTASYNKAAIIIDLIYGLPGQHVEDFILDLEYTKDLPIDGMDLYQLNVFEDGALQKAIKKGILPVPAPISEQGVYLEKAAAWLDNNAYRRLSTCHWAKTSRERSLYNTLTKAGKEIFPFGAGAGGLIDNTAIFLQRSLDLYINDIIADRAPVMFMTQQSDLNGLFSTIQAQAETGRLDIRKLSQKYGKKLLELEEIIEIWINHGLLKRNGQYTYMTIAGQFWQENITQTLIELSQELLCGEKQFIMQPIAR
ncbi:heme anaerobic degradation radical SAM methyltransferase ChuW/HutW [Pectinatus haikarae]